MLSGLPFISLGKCSQQSVLGVGEHGLGVADDVQDAEGTLRRLTDAVVIGDETLLFDQFVGETTVQPGQPSSQLTYLLRFLHRLSLRRPTPLIVVILYQEFCVIDVLIIP